MIRPTFLLLIPLSLLFVYFTSKKLNKMVPIKRNLLLFLRNVLFILIILSLSGIQMKWFVKDVTTIFIMDASDSMKETIGEAEAFTRKAIDLKGEKDQVGVISFGESVFIENFISKNNLFHKIETKPDGRFTNIENALATSISLFPPNTKKRMVLITDGEENMGLGSRLSPSIVREGIEFKLVRINREIENEVAMDGINIPQKVSMGQEFTINVNISSKSSGGGKLTLFSGREKITEKRVELSEGMNRFVFKDIARDGGFKSYRAVIDPDLDTISENNEASSFTNIIEKLRVLLIEDKTGEADEMEKMLSALQLDYVKVNAKGSPSELEELLRYKSIISCNVSADNFNSGFLNSLESYVKDFGGGFIATGGENSFALGGYYKTPLEKILPVNMDLKGEKEIPNMSIVLIIDKSGSMTDGSGGITKLDIAKEAAARTLDSLRDKDEIGVLTFDDTTYWVVKTKKADDPEKIREDIGTIRSGGGTSIIPALKEGYESIKMSNTKIKHIILLTDGQAENTGYEELLARLKKDHITVSTVAVGQDSDRGLLENIAKGADGRFYYTDEVANIPRIFAKETFMAAKAYLNNREFTPSIVSTHAVLDGVVEAGLPPLLGYVASSAKDTARVLLESDEKDPILTVWQYGLGKSVAWNSDIKGQWNGNYVSWDKNSLLWGNLINFTIENYEEKPITIETTIDGMNGEVTLINKEDQNDLNTKAIIVSPSGESKEVILYPVEPGKYEGEFEINETGAYLVKGVQEKDGVVYYAANSGVASSYSPEYKISTSISSFEKLLKETGATIISKPEEVFNGAPKEVFGSYDLTSILLIMVLILFMADIALRRLNLPFAKLEEKFKWLKGKKKKDKPIIIKKVEEAKVEEKIEVKNELDTSRLLKKKK